MAKDKRKSIFEGIEPVMHVFSGYDCQLPVYYYGKRAMAGVFLASAKKIRKKSPEKRFKPMEVVPGVAAVAIIAFEFDTSIGPVNEFFVGIPEKQKGMLPYGLASLQEIKNGYMPAWTMHLPVSTDIALKCGIDGWGFPKTLADIPMIDNEDGTLTTEVLYDGELACRMTGTKKTGKLSGRLTAENILLQKKSTVKCDHEFEFKNIGISFPTDLKLETFSDAKVAKDLDDILLSKKAIASLYIPELEACLYEMD